MAGVQISLSLKDMQSRRTTIMILAPGRDAIHLEVPILTLRAVTLALLVPLCAGVAAQRYFGVARDYPAIAMGSLHRVAPTPRPLARREPTQLRAATTSSPTHAVTGVTVPAQNRAPIGPPPPPSAPSAPGLGSSLRTLMTAVRPMDVPIRTASLVPPLSAAGLSAAKDRGFALAAENVISVKSILSAISAKRRAPREVEPGTVPINGVLRIQALHLDETLSTRPFDDLLRPDPRSFQDINHLMRCRVTGHEVEMDPRLIGILSQLSTVYGRTLQLISGHRAPHANGTSETSQHTLGRAADIRIPGVSIAELKRVAIKLGARGVGIYPEKGFVHVDVREKQRYYWVWTARGGEQADMGTTAPRRTRNAAGIEMPPSEEAGEESDGAADPDPHAEHVSAATPEPAAAEEGATE